MKIICGMATTNKRRKYAIQAMDSLAPYVDEIRLYDNDKELHDYTDNAKFYYLSHYREPIYFISTDDDLIYPEWFIPNMIENIDKYGICTHHGRKLRGLNRDYYRGHYGWRVLGFSPNFAKIDVAGTGCTGFSTKDFNPVEIYRAEDKRMADLVFSLEAAKQGKTITVLPHKEGDFKQLPVPKELTIYERERHNQTRQIEIANEIYKLKYETN